MLAAALSSARLASSVEVRALSTSGSLVSASSSSSALKWAASGWAFFIAENFILSENRTWLIAEWGDQGYHAVYGTLSTAATASIGYAYYKLTRGDFAKAALKTTTIPPSVPMVAASWAFMTLGVVMASQALPKMQIPVTLSGQVRCPFDFSDRNASNESLNASTIQLTGLDRVTRHAGLWSFGLVGIGQALLITPTAMQVWWCGPAAVALLGGMHTDSRFRRGMGGTLNPHYDSMTSNVPFAALLTGQQGNVPHAIHELVSEIKPLNAGMAAAAVTMYVLSRSGRARLLLGRA